MATLQAQSPSLSLAFCSPARLPAPSSSVRIPALDGLRGIAILLVLLRHGVFGLQTSSPILQKFLVLGQLTWSGVDLFFVLSGFLIGGILLDARDSPRYYTTFYARRAYRILPLYYALMSFFLLRHLPLAWIHRALGAVSPLAIPWWGYLAFIQNLFMVHIGWFGPTAATVTWSLAVEEQFYLTTPLLIRNIRHRYLPWALAATVLSVPLIRYVVRHNLPHGDFACYVLMPCRADALCLGLLAAFLVRRPKFWSRLYTRRKLLWAAASIFFAGVAFMTYKGYGSTSISLPMTTFGYTWLGCFYAICLLLVVSSPRGIWHSILCHPLLMSLGTLAYCVYLLHFPLNIPARRIAATLLPLHPGVAFVVGGAVGSGTAIVLAALSWRFYEKPMLRRGRRYQY